MAHFIVKLANKYLIWSSVVDAPVTRGMTIDELQQYIKEELGQLGIEALPGRLKRVEKTGTSGYGYTSVDELIAANRAGPNETELTLEELIQEFCV